jgi:hypothetical protein
MQSLFMLKAIAGSTYPGFENEIFFGQSNNLRPRFYGPLATTQHLAPATLVYMVKKFCAFVAPQMKIVALLAS